MCPKYKMFALIMNDLHAFFIFLSLSSLMINSFNFPFLNIDQGVKCRHVDIPNIRNGKHYASEDTI